MGFRFFGSNITGLLVRYFFIFQGFTLSVCSKFCSHSNSRILLFVQPLHVLVQPNLKLNWGYAQVGFPQPRTKFLSGSHLFFYYHYMFLCFFCMLVWILYNLSSQCSYIWSDCGRCERCFFLSKATKLFFLGAIFSF